MNYHLWLNDLECGVAADRYAIDWRDAMRERYPDDRVHIEPVPDTELIGEENVADRFDPTAVATVRCPRCDAIISFPGFDAMPAYRCPHCHGFIEVMPPVI